MGPGGYQPLRQFKFAADLRRIYQTGKGSWKQAQRFLNVSEAAEFLGVSAASLRKWSDQGLVPVYRTPGGQRRYSPGDLEEFLASMRQPSGDRRRAALRAQRQLDHRLTARPAHRYARTADEMNDRPHQSRSRIELAALAAAVAVAVLARLRRLEPPGPRDPRALGHRERPDRDRDPGPPGMFVSASFLASIVLAAVFCGEPGRRRRRGHDLCSAGRASATSATSC